MINLFFLSTFASNIDYEQEFSRLYRCSNKENSKFCRDLLENFGRRFRKEPLVTQIEAQSLFDNRDEKGHVTLVCHPMDAFSMPKLGIRVQTEHCALITEMFEKMKNGEHKLHAQLFSLQSNTEDGGADTHRVFRYAHDHIIDKTIWAHEPSSVVLDNNGRTFRREFVDYYPYRTFEVDKKKMINVVREMEEEADLLHRFPYNFWGRPYYAWHVQDKIDHSSPWFLRLFPAAVNISNHNCCSYAAAKLKKMGVDLNYEEAIKVSNSSNPLHPPPAISPISVGISLASLGLIPDIFDAHHDPLAISTGTLRRWLGFEFFTADILKTACDLLNTQGKTRMIDLPNEQNGTKLKLSEEEKERLKRERKSSSYNSSSASGSSATGNSSYKVHVHPWIAYRLVNLYKGHGQFKFEF